MGSDFWLYNKDFNPKDRIVILWTRIYSYKENHLIVTRLKINRNTKEEMTLNSTVFNLSLGDVINSSSPKWEQYWEAAIPGTMGYSIFDSLDLLEKVKKFEARPSKSRRQKQ